MNQVVERWQKSTKESGQFSNFGPLWFEACDRISATHGRIALVCSSGTDAVRLAIYACHERDKANYTTGVDFEGFTFEGTKIAAGSMCEPREIATDAPVKYDRVSLRTIPFGMSRRIAPSGGHQVVDAAGAFRMHANAFGFIDKDAVIACSFHATKNYPIGEGGCVLLPRDWTTEAVAVMRAMNFGFNDARVPVESFGTNAKIDELRCSVLLSQLDRAKFFEDRSERIEIHSTLLAEAMGEPLGYTTGKGQSMVVVAPRDPQAFCDKLALSGYATRRVYWPANMASDVESRFVAVPSDLTDDEFNQLCELVKP